MHVSLASPQMFTVKTVFLSVVFVLFQLEIKVLPLRKSIFIFKNIFILRLCLNMNKNMVTI